MIVPGIPKDMKQSDFDMLNKALNPTPSAADVWSDEGCWMAGDLRDRDPGDETTARDADNAEDLPDAVAQALIDAEWVRADLEHHKALLKTYMEAYSVAMKKIAELSKRPTPEQWHQLMAAAARYPVVVPVEPADEMPANALRWSV